MSRRLPYRALLSLALVLCAAGPLAALRVGDAAPPWELPDLAGVSVRLPADLRGKVVVLHFWASWCPSCVAEMSALKDLVASPPVADFVPYSINVAEERAAIEAYIKPLGLSYGVLRDEDSATAKAYGVTGLPTTFILDREGRIRYKILGEIKLASLRKLLLTVP